MHLDVRGASPDLGTKMMRLPLLRVAGSLVFLCFANAAGAVLVPEFELEDLNTRSIRFKDKVSPVDYRQQISVWYFGAAT
jgi:hypothetical protein